MGKIKYTKELVEPIIRNSISYKEVCEKLGLVPSNGTTSTIHKIIKRYNLNVEHFHNHSLSNKKLIRLRDIELFIENSKISRSTVRSRIINKKLIKYECGVCGCDNKWQEKEMPLILDHINGINNDNRLENLRFLCPNCDSIQDTYKGKNLNSDRSKRRLRNKLEKDNNKILLKLSKQEKLNNKINQIKNSNIDFLKSGWRIEVGKYMNWSPQYTGIFVEKYIPEIWNICFKHKDKK